MNRFYQLPGIAQWSISLLMMLFAAVLIMLWMWLISKSNLFFLLLFLYVPVFQFLLAPFFTLVGMYKYLSPMLLVYSPSNKKYDLHNGTSFDYLFLYQKGTRGYVWQSILLKNYLDGLLAIIQELEEEKIPDIIVIRGSSYFFSERTAQKLGFELRSTGLAEKLNIIANYLDLLWMYSLSKGKMSFPKLNNVKTAQTTGARLRERKGELLKLRSVIGQRVASAIKQ